MPVTEAVTEDHLDLGKHNHHAVGLRRDALSPTETLAQSIANIAPTLSPAVNIQLVFGSSGNSTWLTYVLATLGLLLIGVCIKQFAKKTSTPGALYSYVSMSLGPTAGFITGWALILAYLGTGIAVASSVIEAASSFHDRMEMPPACLPVCLPAGLPASRSASQPACQPAGAPASVPAFHRDLLTVSLDARRFERNATR